MNKTKALLWLTRRGLKPNPLPTISPLSLFSSSRTPATHSARGKLVAVGGSAIDYQLSPQTGNFELYKSCIGKTKKCMGGIARNIVDCASRLSVNCVLISAIGRDSQGNTITEFCKRQNIELKGIHPLDESMPSGRYYAIMESNNNELLGISEMQINELLTFDNVYWLYLKEQAQLPKQDPSRLTHNDIFVVDSNIPEPELLKITQFVAQQFGCMIVYEAKGQKAKRIVTSGAISFINLLKMNHLEKVDIVKTFSKGQSANCDEALLKQIGSKHPRKSLLRAKSITTNGKNNIELMGQSEQGIWAKSIKVPNSGPIIKTTGAGDTFTGALCSMLLWGKSEQESLLYARAASKLTIESQVHESVISDKLSLAKLQEVVAIIKPELQ